MDEKIKGEILKVVYKAVAEGGDKSDFDAVLWEIARLITTGLTTEEWLDSLTVEGEFVEVAR